MDSDGKKKSKVLVDELDEQSFPFPDASEAVRIDSFCQEDKNRTTVNNEEGLLSQPLQMLPLYVLFQQLFYLKWR